MAAGGRCYGCFRPAEVCFCDSIPTIDNRTEVLILQHRREYFHRFNTARIVEQSLRNSQLLADHTHNLAERLQLKPGAGLLYPGPSSIPIAELPAEQRPQQLVILDGTWHQTKTLLRDIPALQSLPRYQLSPTSPSRYRIRREPDEAFVSTIEATVAALRLLEPETVGLEGLLQAFEKMVDVQLAHPGSITGARWQARRNRSVRNVPLALQGNLQNIVVAYGEAPPGERGAGKRAPSPPLVWVARRLSDGADFACTLTPSQPLSDVFLGHLELARGDFDTAVSIEEARRRWAAFERPGDVVTVIQPGTAELFSHLAGRHNRCLVLKAVDLKSLPDLETESPAEINFAPAQTLGRATKRLAAAITLVQQLSALLARRQALRASSD
ncbi:tRNA-uridine aminocarboxypropyltransferase [Anatilimnocola floriformis]|uniref:tRNA-uridine aminocarboxypropyltransferase n=1 Tax=Anatilimnocola floriformis TaxID=2948575 RepID=UPI0020C32D3C|nr:tRNA-uridine aminocarboxypropyltransferase [Anatilimnocola floriformis]